MGRALATLTEWHGRRKFKAIALTFTDDPITLE